MNNNQYLTPDALIDIAEDVFEELAQDNLRAHHLAQLDSTYTSHGFVKHSPPTRGWESLIGFTPDAENYAEITFGIQLDTIDKPLILAKVLLSKKKQDSDCHITWYPD